MRLTLLGSGGWIPTQKRETCCALVRDGDRALLLDAGTGVSRLLEHPELLDGVDALDIVLTHFHLDHVAGLAYLPALEVERRLWAPGAWLYDMESRALIARLVDPPLFALGVDDVVASVEEIDPGGLELGGLRIAAQAGVGELVLIHVNPLLNSDAELLADAAAGFERSRVGEDLLEWSARS